MSKVLKAEGIEAKLTFPKKTFFRCLSAKNIEERRRKLEIYLNQISGLLNLLKYPQACEFLEIDIHKRVFLSSLDFELKSDSSCTDKIGECEKSFKQEIKRVEERKVVEFLEELNAKPLSITNSAMAFENFYFGKSVVLRREEIETLLWGTSDLRGLLHFCGNDKSYIAANSCTQLFGKFVKYEYNSVEADKFVEVFARTAPEIIRKMNLAKFMKGMTIENYGFIILYYYLSLNVHGINGPEEILNDKTSISEYEKWLQNKVNCGYLFNLATRKSSSKTTLSESKEDSEVSKNESISEASSDSLDVLTLNEAFNESFVIFSQNCPFNLKAKLDDFTGWNLIASVENAKMYSKGDKELRFLVNLETTDLDAAANSIFDPKQLGKWTKCRWQKLKEENMWQDTVHIIYPAEGEERIEYVKSRRMEYGKDGKSVFIMESSVEGQLGAEKSKRVWIDSCIKLLRLKTEGGKNFIEWQTLTSVKEGITSTIEYATYMDKQIEGIVLMLNGLFRE
eukprot:TRINITY_DN6172_c0_g3_i5.p1 TRINITY_DN6172_c0_g3~~TRINITY_DN6172_c0_g3_i5.p1  ORF type:complete len:509 (-),score=137.78 TRINITY_DN6172_c0_g3_i5:210-1736(-)